MWFCTLCCVATINIIFRGSFGIIACLWGLWSLHLTTCHYWMHLNVPVTCELSMLHLNQQQCVLSGTNIKRNDSNNVKYKGQRDLGGPCRPEGSSLFSSPSFPSTASLTLLKSWDFSTDNPLIEKCCTVREHCTKSTRTPVPRSRDSAHLSSCPFSLRVQYSHYCCGAMALLGYHCFAKNVPSIQRLVMSAVPRVMAHHAAKHWGGLKACSLC